MQETLNLQDLKLEEEIKLAREASWKNLGRKIVFFTPSFIYYKKHFSPWSFPSISITGESCALKCDHCDGKILKTMIPALTPKKLIDVCMEIEKHKGLGCLISGGCLINGVVPLKNFSKAIKEVKSKTKLKIVVHTGLIDEETAFSLKEAGVDAALIDVIGSEKTLKEIYHLNTNVESFDKSLSIINKAGLPLIPHILVGLQHGEIEGEYNALNIISRYNPSALIVIVFFPIKGTKMEKDDPPAIPKVIKFIAFARKVFSGTPIALGCARPTGAYRVKLDSLAVKTGVNGIAFPAEEAVELAKSLNLEILYSNVCCSQIYEEYLKT
ncbi:radical SAM protein [Candidatus Bathyarchaeota archaeon]|nr:radical SAM protein [Candidatus Bathyarchaeota archaeon]